MKQRSFAVRSYTTDAEHGAEGSFKMSECLLRKISTQGHDTSRSSVSAVAGWTAGCDTRAASRL